jgi:predicted nucleic acid-binding protein
VNTLVIDASIAIKWVVAEDSTPEALVLRQKAKLIAPDFRRAARGADPSPAAETRHRANRLCVWA